MRYESPLPRIAFFTLRSIPAGEELTFDYGASECQTRVQDQSRKRRKVEEDLSKQKGTGNVVLDAREDRKDSGDKEVEKAEEETSSATPLKEKEGEVARVPCLCGASSCRGFLPLDYSAEM